MYKRDEICKEQVIEKVKTCSNMDELMMIVQHLFNIDDLKNVIMNNYHNINMMKYRSTLFYISNMTMIFPNEIIILVFSFCDYKECLIYQRICSVFYKAIQILLNKTMIGTIETFPLQAMRVQEITLYKQITESIVASRERTMKAIAMLHKDCNINDPSIENYLFKQNLLYKRLVVLHQKQRNIDEPNLEDFNHIGYVAEIIVVHNYKKESSIEYEVRRLYPIEPIHLHENGFEITVKRLRHVDVVERMKELFPNANHNHENNNNKINTNDPIISTEQPQERT